MTVAAELRTNLTMGTAQFEAGAKRAEKASVGLTGALQNIQKQTATLNAALRGGGAFALLSLGARAAATASEKLVAASERVALGQITASQGMWESIDGMVASLPVIGDVSKATTNFLEVMNGTAAANAKSEQSFKDLGRDMANVAKRYGEVLSSAKAAQDVIDAMGNQRKLARSLSAGLGAPELVQIGIEADKAQKAIDAMSQRITDLASSKYVSPEQLYQLKTLRGELVRNRDALKITATNSLLGGLQQQIAAAALSPAQVTVRQIKTITPGAGALDQARNAAEILDRIPKILSDVGGVNVWALDASVEQALKHVQNLKTEFGLSADKVDDLTNRIHKMAGDIQKSLSLAGARNQLDSFFGDIEDHFDKVKGLAKSIFEGTRTPAEKFAKDIKAAQEALAAHLISNDTFQRFAKEGFKSARDAANALANTGGMPERSAAREIFDPRGFSKSFAMENHTLAENPQVKLLQQILAEAKKTTAAIERGKKSSGTPTQQQEIVFVNE